MRHRVHGKKLGRNSGQRRSLQRNLALALFQHGRIQTTRAKADFVRGAAERLITIAKRGLAKAEETNSPIEVVNARRLVLSRLYNDQETVQKLFAEIAPLYKERNGGYTRIYRLNPRKGDNAEMVLLELVDYNAS